MARELSSFLTQTIESELPELRALSEAQSLEPRGEGKWCPREELGHLIDSASNNHFRFVRAAIYPEMHGPRYDQDEWVRLHGYREIPWVQLVDFWYGYNRLLGTLTGNIPEDRLDTQCFVGGNPPVTLAFLIEDYVRHMQHHIDLLLKRETVRSYPGAAHPD